METHCLIENSPAWFDIVSLIATLFATAITVGYWLKPRLKFCIFREHNRWKVNLVNRNLLRNSVKDIYCEIAISNSENFKIAKTLELQKDSTVFLKACHDNYIFSTKNSIEANLNELFDRVDHKSSNDNSEGLSYEIKMEYQFIRARILAPNFIGVKKVFEKKMRISNVVENECDPCWKKASN